jgi:hypothetical protein
MPTTETRNMPDNAVQDLAALAATIGHEFSDIQ